MSGSAAPEHVRAQEAARMSNAAERRVIKTGRRLSKAPRTLRELRVELDMPLAALSDRTGIPVPTLSMIERGTHVANPDQIVELENALGLDLHLAVMVVHWEPSA